MRRIHCACRSQFFPRASERRVLLIVGLYFFKTSAHHHHITSSSSSHLHISTSSHLHIFHLLIFTSSHVIFSPSHLTSSHLLIFHLLIFTYFFIFTSSHLHIFTCHLLIFTSSHLHMSSSHLHIFSPSHRHVFTSSRLHCCTYSSYLLQYTRVAFSFGSSVPHDNASFGRDLLHGDCWASGKAAFGSAQQRARVARCRDARHFYTQKLLHTNIFSHKLLHTLTHRRSYTKTVFVFERLAEHVGSRKVACESAGGGTILSVCRPEPQASDFVDVSVWKQRKTIASCLWDRLLPRGRDEHGFLNAWCVRSCFVVMEPVVTF